MKNIVLCFIIMYLMASCQTVMVSSSYESLQGFDYDYSNPRQDNQRLRDKTPDWYGKSNWADWKVKQEEKDKNFFYYRGISEPSINNLERTKGTTYWSLENANEEALVSAMQDLAPSIRADVKVIIAGDEEISDKGKTAKYLSKMTIKSAASIQGLEVYERFTRTWEKPAKQGKIIAVHCWIVYRISKKDREEAGKRAFEDCKAADDEKLKQKILEDREAAYFRELSLNYKKTGGLTEKDLSQNEKLFMKKYNQILYIYTQIQTLSSLESSGEDGQDYRKLKEELEEELTKYDPIDKKDRLIEAYQKEIAEKDAVIAELRRYGVKGGDSTYLDNNNEIIMRTETFIVAYPPRPSEILLPAGIMAAKDMVSNRDYISFAIINGSANLLRGELGLEAPAVLVAWNDAARYCNWLSRLYGLTPCYTEGSGSEKGKITGYDRKQNGYRLPEQDEILAVFERGIIKDAEIGVWLSSDNISQPLYQYVQPSAAVDGGLANKKIGLSVVRNVQ